MGLTQVNTSSHLGQSYHVGRNSNKENSISKTNSPICLRLFFDLGLVYTVSDYFSCRIAFLNLVQKTLPSMSVYTKPGKQPSDTISCQNNFIKSTIFVVFFAYLRRNRSTSFAIESDYDVYT